MPHRRSSCTPSLELLAGSAHAGGFSPFASIDRTHGVARLPAWPSPSIHLCSEGREHRPSPLAGVLRGRGWFHPRRAPAERSSSMSDLTFTFTVLLRRASLAKGYCNIYSVSAAPPNAKRRLACSTLPRRPFSDRVRNCSIPALRSIVFLRRRFSDPGHCVFLGFI